MSQAEGHWRNASRRRGPGRLLPSQQKKPTNRRAHSSLTILDDEIWLI
ncbi:hypothetical protein ABI_21770 [Asticcacaulis biprosthecium C19]|uniref:Uncharacterized protein n=1 Tax=Asticcacaulis biprosthecium C19 TaxID=715226 RepID=F4QGY1_9CAUL|nr:hypothetical protein ABI_21770 [Asticcacaulis biprosthecium C19]